jgi:hypothetical protein
MYNQKMRSGDDASRTILYAYNTNPSRKLFRVNFFPKDVPSEESHPQRSHSFDLKRLCTQLCGGETHRFIKHLTIDGSSF